MYDNLLKHRLLLSTVWLLVSTATHKRRYCWSYDFPLSLFASLLHTEGLSPLHDTLGDSFEQFIAKIVICFASFTQVDAIEDNELRRFEHASTPWPAIRRQKP